MPRFPTVEEENSDSDDKPPPPKHMRFSSGLSDAEMSRKYPLYQLGEKLLAQADVFSTSSSASTSAKPRKPFQAYVEDEIQPIRDPNMQPNRSLVNGVDPQNFYDRDACVFVAK